MKWICTAMIAICVTFTAPVSADDDDLKAQIAELQKKLENSGEDKAKADKDLAQHLQDISVTIVSKSSGYSRGGEGSGVIVTRAFPSGETVNFVWTAAHVIDNLRNTKEVIDPKTGTKRTVVEFDDAQIVKSLTEDGRSVGKVEFFAQVVRYSEPEDLALLRLRKKNFVDATVEFYLEDKIPGLGTPLLHVGSLLGQLGSNSMTTGIMSQHGRLIDKKVFDQTTVAAFPGSSGGGVFLTDGRMMGMVVSGAGETFNLTVPVRRMKKWAEAAKISWALDPNVEMISEEELKKLPVEDNGVTFSYSKRVEADAAGDSGPHGGYTVKIIGDGQPHLGSAEMELRYPTLVLWREGKKSNGGGAAGDRHLLEPQRD